ncbi:unnamed protein product [Boreogadus saida]
MAPTTPGPSPFENHTLPATGSQSTTKSSALTTAPGGHGESPPGRAREGEEVQEVCSEREDVFVTGDDRGQSTGLSKRGRQQIWLRPIAPWKIEVLNQGSTGVGPGQVESGDYRGHVCPEPGGKRSTSPQGAL